MILYLKERNASLTNPLGPD